MSLPTGHPHLARRGRDRSATGMDGLAALVQAALEENVFAGDRFIFRWAAR